MNLSTNLVDQSLATLTLGEPLVHRNLAVWPLLAPSDVPPVYLTLDEALERGVAEVTEVSEAGRVPEMRFRNLGDKPVLLVDGEELVGAKQNRILNLTLLVGAGREVIIPVSCVEQGRWSWRRSAGDGARRRKLFAAARAKKMLRVSESLESMGVPRSDQGEIWEDIARKFSTRGSSSASMSMNDLYLSQDGLIEGFEKAIRAQPRQAGAVFVINGRPVGVELFDAPATLARMLPRTVGSFAMDAIDQEEPVVPPSLAADVKAFLDRLRAAAVNQYPSLGEGTDLRISGEKLAGGALAAEGHVVHLAGFEVESPAADPRAGEAMDIA
jgi:hypothetical protein